MITPDVISTEEDVAGLRRSLRDLAALATLPAIWIADDLRGGLQNLTEVLCAAVRARFVYIRVTGAGGELVDAAAQNSLRAQGGWVEEVRGHVTRHLDLGGAELPANIPSMDGTGLLRVAYSHVAIAGRIRGVVIACLPAETVARDHERLLLHTGSAQVAVLIERHAIESARQNEARKLQEQARLLQGLNQVGTALVAELDLNAIVQRVTDVGRDITGAAFGAFFYHVQNGGDEAYTLYALSGAPGQAFAKFPMPRNTAMLDPTFLGEGVVRISDARKDPRFGKNAAGYGLPEGHLPVASYLAVPVKSRTGVVLGGLFYAHPAPNVFTAQGEMGLVSLASQAAIAIDNAKLYVALHQELGRAKQADAATRRLALIVQSSDDAIIAKDVNGIITSWNPAATRIFGYSEQEALGRPIYILIPPDRYHEEVEILDRIRRGLRVDHYETVRRAKDGRLVDVALTVSPLRLADGEIIGASKIARDITERRRVEGQQRALHELADTVNKAAALPTIYDAALHAIRRFHHADRAAILLYDPSGVMRFVAWTGLSDDYRRAVDGHSPWKRTETEPQPICIDDVGAMELAPDVRAAVEREGIKALAFIPLTYEGRLLGKFMVYYDQPHRFTPDELRPIETVASQVAFALERKKSAAELESLVTERTASLQKAIEQMEEFSYSVSHDLRAPVRAMRGYAEVLLTDHGLRLDPQGRELLGRIQRNGLRMDRLIQDLLTYSRLASRKIKLEPVSVDKLVREVIQYYPELGPDVATIQIAGTLPAVTAHEPSLMQAISNLLSNAVKFVAPDKRPEITVGYDIERGRARLWVRDNGIGIAPEHQQRLFGLFERLHPNQGYEGTGIGLAIVRKAVERMGGTVGVISDGTSGCTFWLDLPLAESE